MVDAVVEEEEESPAGALVQEEEDKVREDLLVNAQGGDEESWELWWPCGVVVACLLHTQEVPGSIPGRGSYLRQVSLH